MLYTFTKKNMRKKNLMILCAYIIFSVNLISSFFWTCYFICKLIMILYSFIIISNKKI